VDRVFLDANVLFSAAYRGDSSLLQLWEIPDVTLVTSIYALEEASRNLGTPEQRDRLEVLAAQVEIPASAGEVDLPKEIDLPENDRPILQAAVEAKASHLLSGDRRAFGRYFGQRILGVLVLKPSAYLSSRRTA
jgi:predicted nucleic acid-binding protein